MKRILIFSLAYHPFIGGAEVAIKEITDRCDPSEFKFDMITLRFDRNLPRVEKVGNVTVHRIGWSVPGAKVSDRSLPWRCKIAKVLFPFSAFFKAVVLDWKNQQGVALLVFGKRGKYDMVWAMMANQAGFAALFFKWMYPHIPYVLELQDGRPFGEMKRRRPIVRALWPLYRAIYLKANKIKCISYFIAEQVRMIGYPGPVEVIPNGVDVAKFAQPIPEAQLAALKTRFNKRTGDVFLFTASRLVLSRGVEDVIEALAHLPQNVKFLIAGSGEDRGKLEHIARGLGVSDRVMFAGHVSHDDVPAYFHISDIFVRPSLIEGMGNAFVEAFAAGIPVVATPVGGIPDFLTDEVTGLFCNVQDPKSIARAVERYLDDMVLRSRIVENAKNLVVDKYDWDLIAHNMRENIFTIV
jgi:glycosyltransferase involved in cell wall biosynthesis